jgi:hypothetical protein
MILREAKLAMRSPIERGWGSASASAAVDSAGVDDEGWGVVVLLMMVDEPAGWVDGIILGKCFSRYLRSTPLSIWIEVSIGLLFSC